MSKAKVSNKKSVAFYERGSWYHRTKTLMDDYTVKYGKIGGFSSEEEAEESYYKHEKEFLQNTTAYNITNNANLLLKDYLVYWFERVYSPRVETTTRMIGAYTLYNLLMPNIEKDIKLKLVNTEYLDSLLETIAPICNSAGNKGREILNQAMQSAVDDEILKENPVEETKKYPRKKTNITILTENELRQFLEIVSKDNWYLEILLALFCGLRKGEILGLKFSDFNFEKNTVKITRQITANMKLNKNMKETGFKIIDYTLIEKDPKTPSAIRTLRVPKVVMDEVKKRKELVEYRKSADENYIDNDYISAQKDGQTHSLGALNSYLWRICQRNGIRKITVHGLRHIFATILVELNVTLKKISGLLGHASIHTTFEYYCDIMDEIYRINAFMNNNFIPEGVE